MRRIVLITAVALFLLSGTALADYQQGQVHSTVTGLTGQSVDHSYVWVDVNGQKVLAIDPVCV
ncbi:MAG: hypothetical protein JWN15_2861 [Firmicutes bacterium]|nr:hypothetical protein [Bacillota bacterium]